MIQLLYRYIHNYILYILYINYTIVYIIYYSALLRGTRSAFGGRPQLRAGEKLNAIIMVTCIINSTHDSTHNSHVYY